MNSSGSAAFDLLRDHFLAVPSVRREFEDALRANLHRIDPSDRANRFGSGAAVEWIVAAAAFEAGVLMVPGGHNVNGMDLIDVRNHLRGYWSIKNSSLQRTSGFRISNGMGGAGRGFVDPVILLAPALPGVVFADPTIHIELAKKATTTGDATVLPFSAVKLFSEQHPECVALCEIPINEHLGIDNPWMDYVKSLLEPKRFPRLSRLFAPVSTPGGDFADQIRQLGQLRDDGVITPSQFDGLLESLQGRRDLE